MSPTYKAFEKEREKQRERERDRGRDFIGFLQKYSDYRHLPGLGPRASVVHKRQKYEYNTLTLAIQ
jgi:hypothetical protein